MNQNGNNSSLPGYNTQQVNLADLIGQIWKGKKTVAIFIVGFVILAIAYIFVAKEKWTSSAIVNRPDVGQINNYSNAMNILYGNAAPSLVNIQQDFIDRFNATFSALAEMLDNQDEPEKLTIESAVKGQSLPLKVSYTGQTAEIAQRKLSEFIQQTDDEVAKELRADLTMNIRAKTDELSKAIVRQETIAKEQKSQKMAQINQALTVASQSNIKEPKAQQVDQVSQDTMFMLGSDALNSMMKNEASRPLAFSDEYYSLRQNLLAISTLSIDKAEIHAYRYIMKPNLPIRRDSPKKSIVLAIALFLGAMVGSGWVLARNATKVYNRNI
jgi:chain length determinant protein (polysaccharide antigen chain regulator)